MESEYRERLYRCVLGLAAVYNLGFGFWAVAWPQGFFALFGIEPPRYPAIWQCLGMVVGLYGLAYGYAAWRLDRARPLVAIGLAGKILGPLGWLMAVNSGELPVRTFPLIAFNDLIWWLPFTLILLERTTVGKRVRASAPYVCGAINAGGALALLLALRGGTEAVADLGERSAYIAQHPILWRGGWLVWFAAGQSLLAFYAWWGARLSSDRWGIAALAVGVAGHVCDVLGQSLYIGWLPARMETVAPLGTMLTGVGANGLYTVAGIILTLGTKSLTGPWLVSTWAVWGSGVALTLCGLAGSVTGMVVSAAVMMPLFCAWVVWMGRRLRCSG